MKFSYKAQKKDGEIIKGVIEAVDKFSLARDMKKEGTFLISAKDISKKEKNIITSILKISIGAPVKTEERISFIRNLSNMLSAGLPLMRALSVLERQTKNKKFKKIILSLSEEITKGSELNTAMGHFKDVFSPLTIAMVRAGEKSGNISGSLKIVAMQLEQNLLLLKRVKGALIYPSIIISAMIVVGILMIMFVVPTLSATFVELGVDLPISTKLLIGTSDFLRNHTFLFILSVIGLGVAATSMFKSEPGRRAFEIFLLRLPVIGELAKEVNSARTTRTLSSLLSSGVDIIEAINITKEVLQNTRYKKVLGEAAERIQKGVSLSVIFSEHENLYPVLVAEMSAVGEETGKLSEMLMNVATFYEDSVAQSTKDLSTIIEPILMVVIGVGVGFFAVSMITPLYTVLGGI